MSDAIDSRVAEVLRQPYHWIIQPDEDGFAATVLEFPGCYSGGATPEEAVAELQDAIVTWVSGELGRGNEVPAPIAPEHSSGRLTFRIPPTLHYRAQLRAQVEGVSLNRLLSDAVAQYMGNGTPATPDTSRARLASERGSDADDPAEFSGSRDTPRRRLVGLREAAPEPYEHDAADEPRC